MNAIYETRDVGHEWVGKGRYRRVLIHQKHTQHLQDTLRPGRTLCGRLYAFRWGWGEDPPAGKAERCRHCAAEGARRRSP